MESNQEENWPKVAIIVLNWNGWRNTIECLESLYQITYPNFDIILVDNRSDDESIDKIREYCEGSIHVESKYYKYTSYNKPIEIIERTREETEYYINNKKGLSALKINTIHIIKNERNYGFAEGNNIAIKYAFNALNPKYILLINNDTVSDNGFLTELILASKKSSIIGFVGPKIYFYDKKDKTNLISFAGGKLDRWRGQTYPMGYGEVDSSEYDKEKTVDYLEGSCLLAKKEALDRTGLLDPDYFAYWEDVDLCIRGFKEGYISLYVPKAKIWHKESASSPSEIKMYLNTVNNFLFMKKNAKKVQNFTFLLYFFLFKFWFIIFYILILGNKDLRTFFIAVLKGLYLNLKHAG